MDLMIVDLVSADLVASLVKYILAGATILSIPVSLLLIKRYRMVVCAREMGRAAAADPALAEHEAAETANPPSSPCTLSGRLRARDNRCRGRARCSSDRSSRRTNATALVYSIAGAAFAAVMTYCWLGRRDEGPRATGYQEIAVLFWSYFWPSVLSFVLVIATSGRCAWPRLEATASCGFRSSWVLTPARNLSVWDLPALFVYRRRATNADAGRSDVRPNSGGRTASSASADLLLGPWPCPWSFGLYTRRTQRIGRVDGPACSRHSTVFWALTLSAAALPPLLGWHRLSATAYRYQRRELSAKDCRSTPYFCSLPSFKRSPSSSTRPWAFSPASSHLPPIGSSSPSACAPPEDQRRVRAL